MKIKLYREKLLDNNLNELNEHIKEIEIPDCEYKIIVTSGKNQSVEYIDSGILTISG